MIVNSTRKYAKSGFINASTEFLEINIRQILLKKGDDFNLENAVICSSLFFFFFIFENDYEPEV